MQCTFMENFNLVSNTIHYSGIDVNKIPSIFYDNTYIVMFASIHVKQKVGETKLYFPTNPHLIPFF